jgi:hypothetical protein
VTWVRVALRRFLLPALIGAWLANLAVYRMLEAEGAATDWTSIGVLFAIILAGLLVAWPAFVLMRRLAFPALLTAVLLVCLGAAIGVVAAWLIALQIVPDSAGDYSRFGLAVGPIAALFWLILNFDALRPRRPRPIGDRRG